MDDYFKKYLKYKHKYLQLKHNQKGGNISEVVSQFKSGELIIVLGAKINEPHILQFINEQNPNTTVLCIDLDLNQIFTGELIVPQDNNKLLLQIIEDFNNVELWDVLRNSIYSTDNLKLSKIIVDWSTTKYMNDSYNFEDGSVMNIIKELMFISETKFFSPCCDEGAVIVGNNKIPTFIPYFNFQIRVPFRTDKENLNVMYISEFNSTLRNHEVIYQSESNDQRLDYPITRTPESCSGGGCPIKKFIIIQSKN